MKKKIILLTSVLAVFAAFLASCGDTEVPANHSSDVNVVEESSSTPKDSETESTTVAESSAPESSDVVESSAAESSAATESSADTSSEADPSKYIGMTVNEFVAEGNELNGYMGFNGIYEFQAKNDDTKTTYTLYLVRRCSRDYGEKGIRSGL